MTDELLIDERHPDPVDKMSIMGATGRISDIITKRGYDHLLDILQQEPAEKATAQMLLLHRWTGWAMEFIENGYKRKE